MANALTTAAPPETLTQLSPGLSSLLTLGDQETAIRELTRNPVMLAEAKQALPALKADASRPAGKDGVKRVVGRRMALYPPQSMSDAAWAAWWADYCDTLGDLPEAVLDAGMRTWINAPDSAFLPKPGPLRALALSSRAPAIIAYERAKAATASPPPPEMVTPASREDVQRMLAEYRARLPTPPEPPKRPPTHGKTDETGLTAEMRERLGVDG